MSENLELVRSILASWERDEMTSPQWAEWAHPEIEISVVGGPEPSRHVGLADATPHIEAFMALWEEYRGRSATASRTRVSLAPRGRMAIRDPGVDAPTKQ